MSIAALALGGCMSSGPLASIGDKLGTSKPDSEVARRTSNFDTVEGEERSEVIDALLSRPSLLQKGSPYARVADAALAASARASESELLSARLRAEAQSKNWLPTLGPSVSLTSLGDVVANLLLEQVLFDNGRRKAERAFAAADVEVAAVNLAIDMNERVENAVGLYVSALRGDEKAALNDRALVQMKEFDRIVRGRVAGGVSDRSDLRVVEAKTDDMKAARAAAQEAAQAARAELRAMTGTDFPPRYAPLVLAKPPAGLRPLSVELAAAEGERAVAQTRIDRAGLLPSVTASANVTGDGTSGAIGVGGPRFGFGTPAALKAVEAARDTASRQVAEAEEDARRRLARQERRLASFQRQVGEAEALARESAETFRLFQLQFKAGQRSVMDVVQVYEQMVKRQQAHIDAKYEVILIQLELARELGLLAEGAAI